MPVQDIRTLCQSTATRAAGSIPAWAEFLSFAARMYKYPFHEQLLIYAQRPEATACAPLELWNSRMGRWVKRGARGIALIDDKSSRPCLKYVFDVADTRPAAGQSTEPYLWTLREEDEEAVSKALTAVFGGVPEDSNDFAYLIADLSDTVVRGGLENYSADFCANMDGVENAAQQFRRLVEESVAWCVLTRCGLQADAYLTQEDVSFLTLQYL